MVVKVFIPIPGLALLKQNIGEISHKKLCDSSIMMGKVKSYDMVVVAARGDNI